MVVTVLICGGGNAAHVMAGIAASQPDMEARVMTLYSDEAERWTAAMKDSEFIINCNNDAPGQKVYKSKPKLVSKKAEETVPGADIIVFTVPAFVHEEYLVKIKPHVKPGVVLVGFPGQAGFEFAVFGLWGDLAKQCTIMNFESLPWACRISEFGKGANVLGTKTVMKGAMQVGSVAPKSDALGMLQKGIGKLPVLKTEGHLLGVTLMSVNGYLHPSIMFGRWHDWDGTPVDKPALFYNGLDEFSAGILSNCSQEVVNTAKAVMKQRPNVDLNMVVHMYDYLLRCYPTEISDKTSLYTVIHTNTAYNGLCHPMENTADGKFVPNFKYRYMTEDLPFGLVVMRGIATIAGVPTPTMDRVIGWAQKRMGKEYLVGGKLDGKHMGETRSAQRYGLKTMDAMLGL